MLYRVTGLGWILVIAILVFNAIVELPKLNSHELLGIGPKARAKKQYEAYINRPSDRVFIHAIRERQGLPPVPTPPVDDRTPAQHVAKLTRLWLAILIIPLIPLTLATVVSLLVRGGKSAANATGRLVTASRKQTQQGGSSYANELSQEIVAELASDIIWSLLKRRKT